jgi:hypothetical protein
MIVSSKIRTISLATHIETSMKSQHYYRHSGCVPLPESVVIIASIMDSVVSEMTLHNRALRGVPVKYSGISEVTRQHITSYKTSNVMDMSETGENAQPDFRFESSRP